jgi:fumarate hydratase subunit beta
MPNIIRLTAPLAESEARKLKAGDNVLISGIIYTGRDAAHKRLIEALDRGEKLPVDFKDQFIYYVGPTPAKPGNPIGSAGPTTSGRMDAYAPQLMAQGLRGMIGKGYRSAAVVEAMKKHGAVYFAATGGAGALIAQTIEKCEPVAYPDLLSEAITRLTVKDFPAIVVIDSEGRSYYEEGQKKYR